MQRLMEQAGYREVECVQDFAGLDRVVFGTFVVKFPACALHLSALYGQSVITVISAHDSLDFTLLYTCFEGWKICLIEIFLRHLCIKIMTHTLWSAVNSKMLCTCCRL